MTAATDTLSLVLEGLAYPWQGGRAKDNLLWAAESGTLEVAWTLSEQDMGYGSLGGPVDLQVVWAAEAVDTAIAPCWDGCTGISTEHRPGWCRTNPEHADFDCGCDEPDAWDEPHWGDPGQGADDTDEDEVSYCGECGVTGAPHAHIDTDDEEPF